MHSGKVGNQTNFPEKIGVGGVGGVHDLINPKVIVEIYKQK